jgi:hypothetical protein
MLIVKNHLCLSVVVSQINEYHAAMVAFSQNPAGQYNFTAFVRRAERSARMRSIRTFQLGFIHNQPLSVASMTALLILCSDVAITAPITRENCYFSGPKLQL